MRKKRLSIIIIIGILFVAGLFVIAGHLFFRDKWYYGTTINGISVSGKTLSDSISLFDDENYALTIYGKNDKEIIISEADINLETGISETLTSAFTEQHKTFFLFALFGNEYTATKNITYDEALLETLLSSSSFVLENITESTDAEIVWNGEYYEIEEDITGDEVIVEQLIESAKEAVYSYVTELDISDDDEYYVKADVRTEDLAELCLSANKYVLHWVVWNISDETETLTPDILHEWITINDDGVTFDDEALTDWVEELCLSYKTLGGTRTFTTHDGEEIEISGGDYGWRIDYSDMCTKTQEVIAESDEELITEYIAGTITAEELTTEYTAEFTSTAYQIGTTDWDTENYSEVDISEQMVYVYKDGELAYSCHCVTGLPDGERDTTTGVWYIKDKKEEYTMTSSTYNYTVDTKYWVRITWSGIGYHYSNRDWANWTNTVYKTDGSHGCVNLSLEDAKAIYELVSIGDAVFIHE